MVILKKKPVTVKPGSSIDNGFPPDFEFNQLHTQSSFTPSRFNLAKAGAVSGKWRLPFRPIAKSIPVLDFLGGVLQIGNEALEVKNAANPEVKRQEIEWDNSMKRHLLVGDKTPRYEERVQYLQEGGTLKPVAPDGPLYYEFYNTQGVYTKALASKYPKIPISDILQKSVGDSTFSNKNISLYANDLITKYGEFGLNPHEIDSVSVANNIPNAVSISNLMGSSDSAKFGNSVNTTGVKEESTGIFGPRMMLQRRYKRGELPYKFLQQ